ncbi:hypothetical protein Tco_0767395 [Tanacetum coccineum]
MHPVYPKKAWDETINKMKKRLSRWKPYTLSVGGHLTLLKSVLGSTPIYNMSIFKVPKSVLNYMESMRRNFFNGIQEGDRKIAWVKWSKIGHVLSAAFNFEWGSSIIQKLSFPRLFALEENKDISVADKMNTSISSSFRRHGSVGDGLGLLNGDVFIKSWMFDLWLDEVGTLAMIKSLKNPCIAGFMKPINSTPPPTPPLHHHSPPPTSSSMIVTPSTPKPTTTKLLYHQMPPLFLKIVAKKTESPREKGKNVEDEPQEPVAAGRWLPVEEELLATCYVAVSEDNNVGRSQKHDTFWYRVLNEFNSKKFQNRTKDMLTSKWHTLNANCQKFNAAYKRAKRLGKSGENDVDYLKRAQSIYRDEHRGVAFSQEDAWAVLRFHPKWDAPEQVDLTGDVPGASQEDLFGHDARPRPPGKQRPAKKSKSDATASTGGSSASAQFGELMEQELRLKREAAERAFEAQAEKDRTLMRLEELRFLATSTKDLDEDDAYWIKKQKKLIKNKMKNDLGDEDDEDEDE